MKWFAILACVVMVGASVGCEKREPIAASAPPAPAAAPATKPEISYRVIPSAAKGLVKALDDAPLPRKDPSVPTRAGDVTAAVRQLVGSENVILVGTFDGVTPRAQGSVIDIVETDSSLNYKMRASVLLDDASAAKVVAAGKGATISVKGKLDAAYYDVALGKIRTLVLTISDASLP